MHAHLRITVRLVAGSCFPLLLGACAQQAPGVASASVEVRCETGQRFVSVDPWVLRVPVGASADWTLTNQSTAYSIQVAPKQGRWPFSGNGPQRGNGNTPARSGGPATGPKGVHKYTIIALCGTADAPGDTIVIDPDMDIH